MTDWNPLDPDLENVYYDLSSWSTDHQGEMSAALAQADVPHAWVESELVVPAEYEDRVDVLFDRLEKELGIGALAVTGGVDDEDDVNDPPLVIVEPKAKVVVPPADDIFAKLRDLGPPLGRSHHLHMSCVGHVLMIHGRGLRDARGRGSDKCDGQSRNKVLFHKNLSKLIECANQEKRPTAQLTNDLAFASPASIPTSKPFSG